MKLHLDSIQFNMMLTAVESELPIHRSIIVKDYYVTLFLNILKGFYPEYIFKGGTSLSKCFSAINRFSEDIDISYYVTGDEKVTTSKIKKC